MKTIGIIGCGWIGTRMVQRLKNDYQFVATVATDKRMVLLQNNGVPVIQLTFGEKQNVTTMLQETVFKEVEALIISIPFSKRALESQLLERAEDIASFIGNWDKPIVMYSSIGVYPVTSQRPITEVNCDESELHIGLRRAETFFQNRYPQLTVLRLAGLMGDDRYLSKYKVELTNDPVNHVHYSDVIEATKFVLEHSIIGTVLNVVAPEHPSKKAVIEYENTGIFPEQGLQGEGRVVSGEAITQLYGYQYIAPQPIYFRTLKQD